MEDVCIICTYRLATVTPACGHRQYCLSCFDRTQLESGSVKNCPICRKPMVNVQDTTIVQHRETTLSDAVDWSRRFRQDYPCGCLLFDGQEEIADEKVLQAVKENMEAVAATRLDLQRLRKAMKKRLTIEQYQYVFVKLVENENLHGVLKQLDMRKFEKRSVTRYVQQMVIRTIESPDNAAVLARAGLGTFGSVAFDLATKGLSVFDGASARACAGSNTFVFCIFAAVELYRWSKGLEGTEVAKNIGEHFVGSLAGFGGSYGGSVAGATFGAVIGSVVPFVGTVVGGVFGGILGSLLCGLVCDAAGRWAYRKLLPGKRRSLIHGEEKEEHQLTAEEVANKAAEKFGIDLRLDSFEEAHDRFRRRLLNNHPDKHPNASEEERNQLTAETRDILACWLIVREYYHDKGDVQGSDCEEGFIKAFVLKVFETATNQWKTVRTFFGDTSLGRDINPETEKIETVTFYV